MSVQINTKNGNAVDISIRLDGFSITPALSFCLFKGVSLSELSIIFDFKDFYNLIHYAFCRTSISSYDPRVIVHSNFLAYRHLSTLKDSNHPDTWMNRSRKVKIVRRENISENHTFKILNDVVEFNFIENSNEAYMTMDGFCEILEAVLYYDPIDLEEKNILNFRNKLWVFMESLSLEQCEILPSYLEFKQNKLQ